MMQARQRLTTGTPFRGPRLAVVAVVLAAGTAACGTRLSHDRLLADATRPARDGAVAGQASASGSTGATDAVTGVQPTNVGAGGAASGAGASAASAGSGGPSGVAAARSGGDSGSCTGSKAPIVIASVGEYSGVLGSIETAGTKSVQAWVATVNAHGGLKCHPVRYVVYDAGGDPSRQQAFTQRAVEQDHAIAFVYNGSAIAGGAAVNYIQQHRVPVIGEEGGNSWSCQNSMYFPVMSSCAQGTQGAYQVLAKVVKSGTKVAAITCVEVPYCAAWHEDAAKDAQEAGLTLVSNSSVSLTQPDYTSACLQAKNAGAQLLVLGMDSTAMGRTKRSCSSVGLNVPFIGPGSAFTPAAASDSGLEGAWTDSSTRLLPASDPAVAEWMSALKKYVPGEPISPNGSIGWVAAKVFELAAQNVADAPTSQAILDGLWAIKGNDVHGMTKPLTYVKDQPAPTTATCWFAVTISRGAWSNGQKICM